MGWCSRCPKNEIKVVAARHCGDLLVWSDEGRHQATCSHNGRKDAPGILHIADDGSHRRTASPGLVVFYPLDPIRKGSEVRVDWTFEDGKRLERFNATYHH